MSQKFTLILDSSQISSYLDCSMFWHYQSELHLAPAGIPTETSAMNAGTYGHKLLDIYYTKKLEGYSLNDAMAAAYAYDPDTDTCEKCGCNKEHHKNVLNLVECLRCKKCLSTTFTPKPFQLSQEDRFTVRNRLRDYFFLYQNNDFMPVSKDYIEVGFSEAIYEDNENLFVLEGRIDLIATLQGLTVVVDHKFQMRKHDLYQKSIQFKNYALIAKITTFMINYIRLSKSVTPGETLLRVPVSFSVPELLEWKKRLIKIFFDVKKSITSSEYNQNWASCPGRYNYECYFTKLCEESDPLMRQRKQDQLYQISDRIWRPW